MFSTFTLLVHLVGQRHKPLEPPDVPMLFAFHGDNNLTKPLELVGFCNEWITFKKRDHSFQKVAPRINAKSQNGMRPRLSIDIPTPEILLKELKNFSVLLVLIYLK